MFQVITTALPGKITGDIASFNVGRYFRDGRNTVIHLRPVTPRSTMFSSQRPKSEDDVVDSRHLHIAYSPTHSSNGKGWNVCIVTSASLQLSWVSVNATYGIGDATEQGGVENEPFFRANGRSRMFSPIPQLQCVIGTFTTPYILPLPLSNAFQFSL